MDILEIKTTTQEIELVHPKDGSPLGIFIEILPFDDRKVKDADREYVKVVQKALQRGKELSSEEHELYALNRVCAAITGWRWVADEDRGVDQPTMDGKIPDFTQANVKKLMSQVWFRGQVEQAKAKETDFFTG